MTEFQGPERRQSVLTQTDKDFISSEIERAVEKSGCIILPKDREAVRSWYGMIADIGDGDLDKGVRRTRDFFKFLEGMYNKKNIASGLLFFAVSAAVVGWAIKIFASGLWDFFAKIIK